MPTDKPFARLKFCCTGIDAKSKRDVVEKINALGGVHYYDLMTDVDYLIVGSRDTEKYKFSIKNRPDLKFIGPDVIDSIHKHWIDGEDDGSESLDIGSYFFPVFDDTPVCFARIQMTSAQVDHLIRKVDFRPTEDAAEYYKPSNLLKLFKQHGGAAKETLSRTHQVMITTDPRGTRYDKALEWGIQVVHPIWIVDSIIRGVALRPEDYLLTQNPNETYEKGCDVWDEVKTNGNISKQSSNYQIRRSESAEPEFKRKLANNKANADVWSSIMDNTKRQTKQIMRDRTWDEEEEDEENDEEDNAPESHGIDSEGDDDSNPILADKRNSSVSPESQLFLGFIFYTVGFDSRQFDLLSKAIESFSGEISNDPNDDSITHVVMPSEKGSQYMTVLKVLPKELKSRITNGFVKVVTEFFVERCMFYKRIVLDKWGQPIKGLLSSKKTFKICITGFTGVELMHIEKLINALNFDYCESLTEDRDLLILNINLFKQSFVKNSPKLFQYKCKEIVNCPTGGTVSLMSAKNKIDAAKQWNIPVVSIAYLWEIIEQSASRSHIVMPDITDLQWCIFAPSNYNKPKSLLEYVKNLDRASREGSMSSTCEDEAAESDHSGSTASVKLPSPRRPNARQKYGKLASAGKSPRSIRTKLQEAANSESMDIDTSANPDISLEESMMSQIRYQDNDSLFNQERLLEKLEGSAPNESNKRRRKE